VTLPSLSSKPQQVRSPTSCHPRWPRPCSRASRPWLSSASWVGNAASNALESTGDINIGNVIFGGDEDHGRSTCGRPSGARPQPRPGPTRCIRMVNPEQLRARAEECEAKAQTAHDPDVRRWYRNMAAQWRALKRGDSRLAHILSF